MRPNFIFGLLVLVFSSGVGGFVVRQTDIVDKRSKEYDYEVSQRTFLFGKLVLVPVLATLGLKFLALVPIVLSKIAVLSVMNFLSTNLNLLVSTLFGLKSFLGKHGLWAHEPTKNHSEWETFDLNQAVIQPSLSYVEPLEGRIEKPTKLLKFYNGVYGNNGYKWTYSRRNRPNDRQRLLPVKEQRSVEGQGKYKCYWTTEEDSASKQLDINQSTYDLSKKTIYQSPTYGGQLAAYADPTNSIDPTMENQMNLKSYYEYQPISSGIAEHQVLPGKIDESSSLSEAITGYVQPQPFTEVKEVKSL